MSPWISLYYLSVAAGWSEAHDYYVAIFIWISQTHTTDKHRPANISFLASILTSILGTANIMREKQARQATVYAFTIGILLLIVSIIVFCWIVVATSPHYPFD